MAQTTVVAGGTNNNTGTVLHGGNIGGVATAVMQNVSLADNDTVDQKAGSQLHLSTAPVESGHVGGIRALSTGEFSKQEEGQYVAKVIGDRLAQTDNTTLRSGGSEYDGNKDFPYGEGNHAYGLHEWSYVSGTAIYDDNHRGSGFNYFDAENNVSITHEPLPTDAIPGRLVYRDGSPTPVLDTYKGINES